MGVNFLFVYGTLKVNEPNHGLMKDAENGNAEFVGNARSVRKFRMVIASRYNIPYLLDTGGSDGLNVMGEIFRIDDKMLNKTDDLECHPHYYERFIEQYELLDGGKVIRTMNCWCYFLKKFKPFMLDLPCLSEYSSLGDHHLPYVPSDNTSDPDELEPIH
ncbi:GGACT (predicted) [Pycnogonum litorale]